MATAEPVVEGFFDPAIPALLGTRCTACGSYFFPAVADWCRNPACSSSEFEELPLSTRGRVWSFTDAQYAPPEPYVAADPYVPFALVAVELADEGLVVLGQAAAGVGVADLAVGQEVELVVETLFIDDEGDKLVWRWRPVGAA